LRFERFRVGEGRDTDRDFLQARSPRGAITHGPKDDFEMAVHFPSEERRKDALAADAFRQFLQSFRIERPARVGRGFNQFCKRNVHEHLK
jgi:hypothetical protein